MKQAVSDNVKIPKNENVFILYLSSYIYSQTGNSPHPNYNGMVGQSDYSSNNYIGYGSTIGAATAYQCANSNSVTGTSNTNTNIGLNATTNGNGIVHNNASSGGNPYAMATIGYPNVSASGVIATMPPPLPQHIPQHDKICTKDR